MLGIGRELKTCDRTYVKLNMTIVLVLMAGMIKFGIISESPVIRAWDLHSTSELAIVCQD